MVIFLHNILIFLMDNKRENMEKINDMYTQVAIAAT